VATANANTAANPALELLNAAVMTSPLDPDYFDQPDPLAHIPAMQPASLVPLRFNH
jgi:hypothetical protein